MYRKIFIVLALIAGTGIAAAMLSNAASNAAVQIDDAATLCEKANTETTACCDNCPCKTCACTCDACSCATVCACKDCDCTQCACAQSKCACCESGCKKAESPSGGCGKKIGCKA